MGIEIVEEKIIVWKHPAIVWATPKIQFGQPYLAGVCPECGMHANLSGEGKHCCVNCNRCLEFKDASKKPTWHEEQQ